MRNLVAITTSCLLLFSACAGTSPPRGQVVRLQHFSDENAAPLSAPTGKTEAIYSQKIVELPLSEADAAVFHFSMGQAYSLDNDPPHAIESFRATLVHDPKSALVRARLAAELVKINEFVEAKTLCEEAIAIDPKYLDSYLLLAGIQVAAKEYEGAVATYRRALKVDATNRDALLYVGVTLAELGKFKEGSDYLEKLVKLKDSSESNIDRSVAYYYLAKIQEQAGNKDAAMRALQSALQYRPGFPKAALSLADIYLARKEESKANETLRAAFRESQSSDLAERLAEIYLEKNDYKGAIVYLETLVEEDPSNENMKLRLALVYWQLKWLDKARFLLTDLYHRYPTSSEIVFYLGELEADAENFEAAISFYKKISPDYAKYEQMVSRVAYLYRQAKRYDEAEAFLLEALRKRPDVVAFYPVLAALYEDQAKTEDARLSLERGEKLFPADENILYYLGFLYDRVGEKQKGLETMERLLKINPDNANALNFVGYTLLEQGNDIVTAAKHIERALALKPDDAFVLDSYGWLLYRQAKHQLAARALEQATRIKPEEAVIAEHLGDVYAALKLTRKALAMYERALSLGGDEEFVARVETKKNNVQQVLAETDRRPVYQIREGRRPSSQR